MQLTLWNTNLGQRVFTKAENLWENDADIELNDLLG